MNRNELRTELAQIAQHHAEKIPNANERGLRVVVIVTNEDGEFVGVGMNTHIYDAIAIMRCALKAEDMRFEDGCTIANVGRDPTLPPLGCIYSDSTERCYFCGKSRPIQDNIDRCAEPR